MVAQMAKAGKMVGTTVAQVAAFLVMAELMLAILAAMGFFSAAHRPAHLV
jgi:hypothetical protein